MQALLSIHFYTEIAAKKPASTVCEAGYNQFSALGNQAVLTILALDP
jgi:hypothetical protein